MAFVFTNPKYQALTLNKTKNRANDLIDITLI